MASTASIAALVQAHRSRTQIEALPAEPSTIAEAHAIQDGVAARLGEAIGAFKATAPQGEPPTRGLIYARMIKASPARLAPAEVPHLGVEAEIAFRFTRNLPPRDTPYTREEVAETVTILPAIEVVSGRFRDPRTRPRLEQLADCMANGALVTGPELNDWSHLDVANLRVRLLVNDAPVMEQQGSHPTGDPLGVAVALVNLMRDLGGVKAGQFVATGSWTGMRFLQPGDRCTIQFETLGEAAVTFER